MTENNNSPIATNALPGSLPNIYFAAIFEGDTEGVELQAEIGVDLEALKASVQRTVDRVNNDRGNDNLTSSWSGLTYYPDSTGNRYDYCWARIQEIHPGLTFLISEYA